MTTAFVLSGGGAAGDFEVGAVRLLLQRGFVPDILVGTSVGAINAAKIAEGEGTPDQGFAGLLAIWLSLRSNDDMWKPAAWISTIDFRYQGLFRNLVVPTFPEPGRSNNEVDRLINSIFMSLGILVEGPKIVDVIKKALKARSLATLDPIGARAKAALDIAKIRASGRKLRLGTVSLESGRLRFVTETGTVVERDQVTTVGTMAGQPPARVGEIRTQMAMIQTELYQLQEDLREAAPDQKAGMRNVILQKSASLSALRRELATLLASVPRVPLTVPLPVGIMASSSIAVLFPPVQIGDEFYVDGGHRDQLSAAAAVTLNATAIFSVLASPSVVDAPTPDHPNPENVSYATKSMLEIGIRAGFAVHLDEMVAADILPPAGFAGSFTLITPTISLHNVLTVDPGLIRQNIAYGFMRAADVLDNVDSSSAAGKNADDIILLRAQMWRKECELFARQVPTDPGADSSTPVPARYDEILADAARLRGMVASRRQAGRALPPDAARWGTTWEDHPWVARCEGPATAISPFVNGIEIFARAQDGRTMTASWAPSPQWTGWRAIAHGYGTPKGWVEAVMTAGEVHAFVIAADGGVQQSVRPIGGMTWSQWSPVGVTGVGNDRSSAGAPVHAISRIAGEIDLFYANFGGEILTTHWSATTGWTQPRQISLGKTAPGGHVTAVSRNPTQLDIFTVGTDGRVYTAGLTAGANWTGWSSTGTEIGVSGAYVSAVSRSVNMLDIFFVNNQGRVVSAAHDPSSPNWKGIGWINRGMTAPGSYVTAISANPDLLALFVVGSGGMVSTVTWSPATGWSPGSWLGIPGTKPMSGLPVWPVSRTPGQIDIVYTTINNTIETAGWAAPTRPFDGPFQLSEFWQLDNLR